MTQQSLTEDSVVSGFHSLLKDSLAQVQFYSSRRRQAADTTPFQARGEGLLTDDELEEGGTY